MALTAGTVFAGYTIQRLLGTGGMGEVYLAQHPRLPRREALKVLAAEVSADPTYRRRFEREADLAATLWHPHIVEIHDRGEYHGRLWITMDYVDGTDAARLLRDRYPHGMPVSDALEVGIAIADALDYAHQRNLLHRDVKPANILIARPDNGRRRILLADFGIARDTSEASRLTATNVTVGTVDYASPEQLLGRPLDGRTDQYSLACTMFRLLTGSAPFGGSAPAVVIGHHLSAPPPLLSTVAPSRYPLDDALARAMAKDPAHRFADCRTFMSALGQRHTEAMTAAAPTRRAAMAPPRPDETPSRGTARAALLAVGAALALVAVGLVAFLGARLAQPPPAAQPVAQPTTSPTAPRSPSPVATRSPPTAPTRADVEDSGGSTDGDLGLATPISSPSCDGQGIVILGSVTTPGLYAAGVRRLLDAHPGAFYLRTDRSCPSLRQATDAGNPIYAVFARGGTTVAEVCAAVRAASGSAYGKWLDMTTDPGYIIPC